MNIIKKKIYMLGMNVREFCEKNHLDYQRVINACKSNLTPSIFIAKKISIASKGTIKIEDFLSTKAKTELEEWLKKREDS